MSQQIIQVKEWKPDYTKECDVCGANHVVTGWNGNKKVFSGDMCGVCTWGEADMADEEQAITLKEAAERLKLSYGTIFAKRESIGFRLPGSRVWRVWPSDLAALSKKCNNLTRLSLRVEQGENTCQSVKNLIPVSIGSISARQAVKELDALLAQKTRKPHRSITTK